MYVCNVCFAKGAELQSQDATKKNFLIGPILFLYYEASIWEKAISILAGKLNQGLSYHITAVLNNIKIFFSLGIFHGSMTARVKHAVKIRVLFVMKYYSCWNNGPIILPQVNQNKFTQLPLNYCCQNQHPFHLILVNPSLLIKKDLCSLKYFHRQSVEER